MNIIIVCSLRSLTIGLAISYASIGHLALFLIHALVAILCYSLYRVSQPSGANRVSLVDIVADP